jgi:hypothetical protein
MGDSGMSEFKGTKGEWKLTSWGTIVDSEGLGICQEHGITNGSKWDANAQLISCAPEMLEMLQDIANTLENGDTPHVYQIRDLITKATTI